MRKRHKTSHPGIYFRVDAQDARRYIVWYRDALGKGRTETLPLGANLEDAKARQGYLRARAARGERLVPTKMTVDQLLDQWLERKRSTVSASSAVTYAWGVERAKEDIGKLKVVDVSPNTLVALRERWVEQGRMKNTIAKIESPLRMALATAVRDGHLASNPFDKLLSHESVRADAKQKRALTSDEIQRLLAAAPEEWYPHFAFLVSTGLRFTESAKLRWDDVDFEQGVVRVRAEEEGARKTPAARREVMLIPALRSVLKAWKLKQAPGTELVFPVTHSRTNKAMAAACETAGIERCTPHELRHTFASILIDQRETPVFVCGQMGHANPHVTYTIYAHMFDAKSRIDEARERLQTAMGGLL